MLPTSALPAHISFSGQESTLTKHLLLVLKTSSTYPICFFIIPFSLCYLQEKHFFKYSLQVLIFRFFCGVYLHKQWKVVLIPCSISPGSVKGSMFVFLSWRVAYLNKIYANELEVLYVLLNAIEKQKFTNLNYFSLAKLKSLILENLSTLDSFPRRMSNNWYISFMILVRIKKQGIQTCAWGHSHLWIYTSSCIRLSKCKHNPIKYMWTV